MDQSLVDFRSCEGGQEIGTREKNLTFYKIDKKSVKSELDNNLKCRLLRGGSSKVSGLSMWLVVVEVVCT